MPVEMITLRKVGNQNKLRPEDIERIVSAYRKRESIEKFSHVASLSEVEENEYNLNIPRYVDTFEEEEPVDLAEVSQKLVDIGERDGRDGHEVIADFCDELGIRGAVLMMSNRLNIRTCVKIFGGLLILQGRIPGQKSN